MRKNPNNLYIRGHKTAPFGVRMELCRSVFRSKKPRASGSLPLTILSLSKEVRGASLRLVIAAVVLVAMPGAVVTVTDSVSKGCSQADSFLSPQLRLNIADFQGKWPVVADSKNGFLQNAAHLIRRIESAGTDIGILFGDLRELLGTNSAIPPIKLGSLEIRVNARKSGLTIEPELNETEAINAYYCIAGRVGLEIFSEDGKLLGKTALFEGDVYYGLKGYKYRKIFYEDAVLVEVKEEGVAENRPENMTLTREKLEKRIFEEMKLNMPEVVEDGDKNLIAGFRISRETDVAEGRYQVYAPKELMLDVGINKRDDEATAPLHIHTSRKGETNPRVEIVIVDRGGLRVGMFTDDVRQGRGVLKEQVELPAGSMAIFSGAHEVTFLGTDTRVIEMKQGPYPVDVAGDKIFLENIGLVEQMSGLRNNPVSEKGIMPIKMGENDLDFILTAI